MEANFTTDNHTDLQDVLNSLRNNIFSTFNCIQIGKISKFDKDNQTVDVDIQIKRQISGDRSETYAPLKECPLVVMQGGGSYMEFPVKVGDFCIVLFNDRDIDNWWYANQLTDPNTKRKHDLSDGIAIVGINPSTSVLDLSGDKVRINATGYDLHLKTDKETVFNEGTDYAVRFNELEKAYNSLKSTVDKHITVYNTHTHTASGSKTSVPSATAVSSTPDAALDKAKVDKVRLP